MPEIHQFRESLELSHQFSDAPWWMEVYRAAFPDLAAAVCVRDDGWAQRGGISVADADRYGSRNSGSQMALCRASVADADRYGSRNWSGPIIGWITSVADADRYGSRNWEPVDRGWLISVADADRYGSRNASAIPVCDGASVAESYSRKWVMD